MNLKSISTQLLVKELNSRRDIRYFKGDTIFDDYRNCNECEHCYFKGRGDNIQIFCRRGHDPMFMNAVDCVGWPVEDGGFYQYQCPDFIQKGPSEEERAIKLAKLLDKNEKQRLWRRMGERENKNHE